MHIPSGLRLVNTLQGTRSRHDFSRGNTLPLTAMPFGMNHWTPQTDESSWAFHPEAAKLQGIRCTHQPSPWMGDYGQFVLMPQVGDRMLSAGRRASSYVLEASYPHYLRVELLRYGTSLEVSPTERGAIFRIQFPAVGTARLVLQPGNAESHIEFSDGEIHGFTRVNSGGVPEAFAHYFVIRFDRPATLHAFQGDETVAAPRTGDRVGAFAEFEGGGTVNARVATSFISCEQARRTLDLELGERPFEEILASAERAWTDALGRIDAEFDDEDHARTFASCLYRAHLFPRTWSEPGVAGDVHWSPYDGNVHAGAMVTDNGFWDTFRTVYPLYALIRPDHLPTILDGWVQHLREGGWFPQWATPGYRACMVGTHIDAVFGDALCKGIRGFDADAALDGMLRHARERGDDAGAYGRLGIEEYLKVGYVYADRHDGAVARSLDYAYDDFCIAQAARALGRDDEGALARSTNYRHSFNPEHGFFQARNSDGKWEEPFDPFRWGGGYVEGCAWQFRFSVPHDPDGLADLLGGREALVRALDEMLASPPTFSVGTYGFEIHEMSEVSLAQFGQYAQSNQPVHHALYLYATAGAPERTRHWVQRVMREYYTPDAFPGDEDNGEMASWYVFSALGFYPMCPGKPEYVLGAPLVRKATLHLPSGRDVEIENRGPSPEWNGAAIEGPVLNHFDLAAGGKLAFV